MGPQCGLLMPLVRNFPVRNARSVGTPVGSSKGPSAGETTRRLRWCSKCLFRVTPAGCRGADSTTWDRMPITRRYGSMGSIEVQGGKRCACDKPIRERIGPELREAND